MQIFRALQNLRDSFDRQLLFLNFSYKEQQIVHFLRIFDFRFALTLTYQSSETSEYLADE